MITSLNPSERLILALDGMDEAQSFLLIEKLPELKWVKVGLELFISSGPSVIKKLQDKGLRVFLDLKFHDIPATMSGACLSAARTGAEMITLHSCAGHEAMKEAVRVTTKYALEKDISLPILLGVTVLTSWSEDRIVRELSLNHSLVERVKMLASSSSKSGLGGIVCSPLELKYLRSMLPDEFEFVTPGIRLRNSISSDQVRVSGPYDAIKSGATRLVVGRPITQADDPAKEFSCFIKEINKS